MARKSERYVVGPDLDLDQEEFSVGLWGGWDSNPRPRDYESPALTG